MLAYSTVVDGYVSALCGAFDNDAKKLKAVYGEVIALQKIYQEVECLRHLCNCPGLDAKSVNAFFDSMLEGVSLEFKNFIFVIIENNRLFLLDRICKKFLECYSVLLGNVNVKVFSISKIGAAEIKELSATLSSSYEGNIVIENVIDKSILGGTILLIGCKMLDFSLRTKLKILETVSKEAILILKEVG